MNPRWIAMGLVVMGAVVCFGCAEKDPLGRKAISGKVTVDGQLAPRGNVIFDPGGNGATLSGAVIVNGNYKIPREKGLAPGEYTVSVSVPDPSGRTVARSNGPPLLADLIPPNSQRKVTVKAEDPNVFDFEFKTK